MLLPWRVGKRGLRCSANIWIGVVLLDMKMPGMSGEETYRILRQVDPNIKVILSSGYNESEVSQHFNEHGVMAFLQKPYNYDLLTQQVYKILLN